MSDTRLRIGYKRLSTVDQDTERQLDGLHLSRVYEDKGSSKDPMRPQLQALLAGDWKPGTTLVV